MKNRENFFLLSNQSEKVPGIEFRTFSSPHSGTTSTSSRNGDLRHPNPIKGIVNVFCARSSPVCGRHEGSDPPMRVEALQQSLLLVSGAWALLPPLYARAEGDAGVAPAIPRCPVRATPAWPAGWRVPPPMPCLGLGSPSATAPPLPRHARGPVPGLTPAFLLQRPAG